MIYKLNLNKPDFTKQKRMYQKLQKVVQDLKETALHAYIRKER